MIEHLTQASYLLAAILFVLSLRWLNSPKTARRGVAAGVAGMSAAIIGTLLHPEIVNFTWIIVAFVVGTIIGVPLSRVPLTAVPNGRPSRMRSAGLAAGLVGTAKYILWVDEGLLTPFRTGAIGVECILGYLTFTGSLMAAGKLQEVIPTRPITYRGQNLINFTLLRIVFVSAILLIIWPHVWPLFVVIVVISLLFGVLLIIPIGGADMPTVISLLNSYGGPVGRGYGLRAREQGADHRWGTRRVFGPHPVDHHVPRDESLVHQRPVRRVRRCAGKGCGRRSADCEEW